jgi:hypothetical protein
LSQKSDHNQKLGRDLVLIVEDSLGRPRVLTAFLKTKTRQWGLERYESNDNQKLGLDLGKNSRVKVKNRAVFREELRGNDAIYV